MAAVNQRRGVLLDRLKLDRELALRAVDQRTLASTAGIHESVISRARHGARIDELTLRRLGDALLSLPVREGVALLLADPEKKTAEGRSSPAVEEVAGGPNHRRPHS